MKNKFKKIFLSILMTVMLISVAGCTKLNGTYTIYDDGEYKQHLEVLIAKNVMDLPDLTSELLLDMIKSALSVEESAEFNDITKNVDGIDYIGFTLSKEKSKPTEEGAVKIEVDNMNKEILFTLNNANLEENFISIEPYLGEEFDVESLKALGVEAKINFEMPGKILSTSGGVINENIVEFDLLNSSMREIIIRSKIPGLTIYQALASVVAVIIAIGVAVYLYKKKAAENISETNIEDEIVELEDEVENTETKEVTQNSETTKVDEEILDENSENIKDVQEGEKTSVDSENENLNEDISQDEIKNEDLENTKTNTEEVVKKVVKKPRKPKAENENKEENTDKPKKKKPVRKRVKKEDEIVLTLGDEPKKKTKPRKKQVEKEDKPE